MALCMQLCQTPPPPLGWESGSRLIGDSTSACVKEAVRLSEVMSASRSDSWFMKVKTIINKLGFAYVLDQPEALVNSGLANGRRSL